MHAQSEYDDVNAACSEWLKKRGVWVHFRALVGSGCAEAANKTRRQAERKVAARLEKQRDGEFRPR